MRLKPTTPLTEVRRALGPAWREFLDTFEIEVAPDDMDLRLDAFCNRYNLDISWALEAPQQLLDDSEEG